MLESCAFEGQFLPPLKPEGHWGTFRFHRVLGRSRDLWLVARSEHDGVMDVVQNCKSDAMKSSVGRNGALAETLSPKRAEGGGAAG